MNTLDALQNHFQCYILGADPTFIREIAGADDDYRRTRLGIYYNAYRLRLIAALETDYEVLKAFVGDSRFKELALAYVQAHPSQFRNLRWYGDTMAGFLRNDARFSAEPLLSELAEFEWAQGLAFDAPDTPLVSFDDLASVPPDEWADIRFIQHPSLHLIKPNWNVVAIWHAHTDGKTLPAAVSGEQAYFIAVWRKDYKSFFRTLEHDESLLWQALANGTGFGDACAELASATGINEEEAPLRAAQLLRNWVDEGWIQSYEIPQTD
jgi:hypothetical protein